MIEQSSRPLKIVLGILFVILLAGLAFLYLSQKAITVPVAPTPTPITTTQTKTPVTPVTPSSPKLSLSKEEFNSQFKVIEDQLKAGTISSEEAIKKHKDLNAQAGIPLDAGIAPQTSGTNK